MLALWGGMDIPLTDCEEGRAWREDAMVEGGLMCKSCIEIHRRGGCHCQKIPTPIQIILLKRYNSIQSPIDLN
jgi:hypothetical protein